MEKFTTDNLSRAVTCVGLCLPFKVNPDIYQNNNNNGMQTFALNLKDVNYTVTSYKGPWWRGFCLRQRVEKQILQNITIRFNSGELTAILGGSGAGKTSLLDFIAFQTTGNRSGEIMMNNKTCTKRFMDVNSTYVVQDDCLLPNLTVRETLTYAALLRQPHTLTTKQIDQKVNNVIKELSLQSVADTKVGGKVKKVISGGEKRRLSIGIHLMQDPKVIIVDEATTGLDSNTAMTIVKTLKKLAERGMIVLLTIHQPSSKMQKLFDKICIMSEGRLVFCGSSQQMISFYQRIGFPCTVYCNPLDFYVDLSSIDKRDKFRNMESHNRVTHLVNMYSKSPEYRQICHSSGDNFRSAMWSEYREELLPPVDTQRKSAFRTVNTLIRRMTLDVTRDRAHLLSRVFLMPIMAPIVVAFLGRLGSDQTGIQDRVGLLYQSLIIPPYIACVLLTFVFPILRNQYLKERRDHVYSPYLFLLSYLLHAFPFQIISSFLFATIVYWSSGLQPSADKYFMYLLVIIFLNMFGEIMMVGAMFVFKNNQIATNCVTLFLTMTLLTSSGLLRSLRHMFGVFKYLSWVTLHKYVTEILVETEFHGLQFSCTDSSECGFRTGEEYLEEFFPDANEYYARNFNVLIAQYLFYVILALILIKLQDYRKSHT